MRSCYWGVDSPSPAIGLSILTVLFQASIGSSASCGNLKVTHIHQIGVDDKEHVCVLVTVWVCVSEHVCVCLSVCVSECVSIRVWAYVRVFEHVCVSAVGVDCGNPASNRWCTPFPWQPMNGYPPIHGIVESSEHVSVRPFNLHGKGRGCVCSPGASLPSEAFSM